MNKRTEISVEHDVDIYACQMILSDLLCYLKLNVIEVKDEYGNVIAYEFKKEHAL